MIDIYTDGSFYKQDKRGGWAAVILQEGQIRLIGNGLSRCENNHEVELQGLLQALRGLNLQELGKLIRVNTDSEWLSERFTQKLHQWHRDHWRESRTGQSPSLIGSSKPVRFAALWQQVWTFASQQNLSVSSVKGHAGLPPNEIADFFARYCSHNQIAVDQTFNSFHELQLYQGPLSKAIPLLPPTPS